MDLSKLKPKTQRQRSKRVGRGGKRGTTSGHGTKGQKSRAGSYVRPGFRGGDNRIWQLFPKLRGVSKKHGNKRIHRKHRFFKLPVVITTVINVNQLNVFSDGQKITPQVLYERKIISHSRGPVKVLGMGDLKRQLQLEGLRVSKSAAEKIAKAGGSVENSVNKEDE